MRVGRTITLSACNGQRVNQATGEFEDFFELLTGDYTPARATRAMRRKYHDSTIVINNVETNTDYYSMDALDFVMSALKGKE